MKKLFLLYFSLFTAISANAQLLHENFDASCSSNNSLPPDWDLFTIAGDQSLIANLQWNCTPEGENNTPGALCTGIVNNTFYLDTAYLFTPEINLTGITGPLYFQFDAKYVGVNQNILSVFRTNADSFFNINTIVQDLTDSVYDSTFVPASNFLNPVNGEWRTYQINITSFEGDNSNIYMAFRYTSDTDSSGTWTIDNVKITDTLLDTSSLSVGNVVQQQTLPLTVIGLAQPDNIMLSYQVMQAGNYTLSLYDMVGRQIYSRDIYTNNNRHTLQIEDQHLSRGMYIIKMNNGQSCGVAKAMVE